MSKVKSTIKINKRFINNVSKAAQRAAELTAETIHTDLIQSQTMPFATGALQGEKTFVDTGKSSSGIVNIVTEGPYARRLYYHPEYNFSKEENPQAGGKWFEPYANGEKTIGGLTIQEVFKIHLARGTGL